jgi:hypothetical protein
MEERTTGGIDQTMARKVFIGLALSSLLFWCTAHAGEVDFLNRFAGSFSGSGQVKRNAQEDANQVQCTLTGLLSTNGISISGQCGAFIFTKRIRVDIRFHPSSGRYIGTYVGSSIGPARLSGKRQDDVVVLKITWPQPVNGDTEATMRIHNPATGSLPSPSPIG